MISLLSPTSIHLVNQGSTPKLFAHTARQHRNTPVGPKLPHRYRATGYDQRKPTSSRERRTKPEAIAKRGNKTFSFSIVLQDRSTSIVSANMTSSHQLRCAGNPTTRGRTHPAADRGHARGQGLRIHTIVWSPGTNDFQETCLDQEIIVTCTSRNPSLMPYRSCSVVRCRLGFCKY